MIPGRGVAAKVEGYHALAGNRAMLNENNITFPQQMTTQAEEFINRGCTMIYISLDSLFIGYVVLSDTIRSESVGTIKVLESQSREHPEKRLWKLQRKRLSTIS